jgi:hypothetical protein
MGRVVKRILESLSLDRQKFFWVQVEHLCVKKGQIKMDTIDRLPN